MELELQIKDLERKLMLKKALGSVHITFGKGSKAFPDEVRAEVEAHLLKHARELAERVEEDSSEQLPLVSSFSKEELEALKLLAKSVLEKKAPPKATASKTPATAKDTSRFKFEPAPMSSNVKEAKRGVLMFLDNVHISQRSKVDSGSEVNILEARDDRYLVRDPRGNQFWIPKDDIEFIS